MEAFRRKQTVPTQCRRGPPGTSSALRGRRERRSSAMPARRPTPELRYGHHPVGPDSPVRACASLCARRPCEEQPCARIAGGVRPPHHPVQRRMHRRESSAPAALVAAGEVVRVAARRQRPGDGARKQRRASAAIEGAVGDPGDSARTATAPAPAAAAAKSPSQPRPSTVEGTTNRCSPSEVN